MAKFRISFCLFFPECSFDVVIPRVFFILFGGGRDRRCGKTSGCPSYVSGSSWTLGRDVGLACIIIILLSLIIIHRYLGIMWRRDGFVVRGLLQPAVAAAAARVDTKWAFAFVRRVGTCAS